MRILFIGAINLHKTPTGGEEYKNQLLYSLASNHYSIRAVDTYKWRTKPSTMLRLLVSLLLMRWDRIIVSASSHSVYNLTKILNYLPNISKQTIYFVIGGYLPTAILSGKFKVKTYQKLNSVVVEGNKMKADLALAGYNGTIHVIPNFKQFPMKVDIPTRLNNHVKFLFLSRIHPDKGIQEIIDATKLLEAWGINNFDVTLFGPLDINFNIDLRFADNSKLSYAGTLDIINAPDRSYEILEKYDIMLFPSYWKGEGFPGVLIDAFVAGLPVIATNWNMNGEVIEDGKSGLLIPHKDAKALALSMKKLIEDKDLRLSMSLYSKNRSINYHIDTIWPQIQNILES